MGSQIMEELLGWLGILDCTPRKGYITETFGLCGCPCVGGVGMARCHQLKDRGFSSGWGTGKELGLCFLCLTGWFPPMCALSYRRTCGRLAIMTLSPEPLVSSYPHPPDIISNLWSHQVVLQQT